MSEDESAPAAETAPDVKTPMPHPWLPLLLGFAGLTAAAIICVALVVQFFDTRTMNLLGHSQHVADNLEQLLLVNHVPQANILRSQGHLEDDSNVRWYSCEFDVTVPEGLNAAGLEQVIRRNMPRQNVMVSDVPSPDMSVRSLTLSLSGRPFADLRLHTRQPLSLKPDDETGACEWIVNETVAALQGSRPALGSIDRRAPVRQSQDGAIWTLTRVRAAMPEALTVAAVRRTIETALADPDVRVEQRAGPNDTEQLLVVSYKGLECLELTLAQDFAPSSTALPPVELPSVPSPKSPPEEQQVAADPLPAYEELPLESSEFDGPSVEPAPSAPPPDQSETAPTSPEPEPNVPKIAIIVDDGGYGGPVTETILGLDRRLTLAILPHCPATTETAERATGLGFEILLHMPMEPDSKLAKKFPGAIWTNMTVAQIQQATVTALGQVPGAVGINNHRGSRFTSDRKALPAFFKVVQSRGLFFLDSRTTPDSVAYDMALELGIPAAKRDVFLDNEADSHLIRKQLLELVERAKSQGSAIGICHFRSTTAKVLSEMLPKIEASGVQLVHASELVK